MVLFPIVRSSDVRNGIHSAWDAIELRQKEAADDWWLVAQTDHAAIAGVMARRIESHLFPSLDNEIVQAIASHDDGWGELDSAPRQTNGRPLSFINAEVTGFLQAWRSSIRSAGQHSAIGGILVSEHFRRIAQLRPPFSADPLLSKFLDEETERQKRLMKTQSRSHEEISVFVDVLQFCDLLSLYVCCGSLQDIEFPQKFQGVAIRLHREGELCRMDPAIFGGGMSLAAPARKFSNLDQGKNLPILFS